MVIAGSIRRNISGSRVLPRSPVEGRAPASPLPKAWRSSALHLPHQTWKGTMIAVTNRRAVATALCLSRRSPLAKVDRGVHANGKAPRPAFTDFGAAGRARRLTTPFSHAVAGGPARHHNLDTARSFVLHNSNKTCIRRCKCKPLPKGAELSRIYHTLLSSRVPSLSSLSRRQNTVV
jgi:hypothetical protein